MLDMYTVGMHDMHTIFGIKLCPFPTCYICIHCSLFQHQKRATATIKYLSPQDMTININIFLNWLDPSFETESIIDDQCYITCSSLDVGGEFKEDPPEAKEAHMEMVAVHMYCSGSGLGPSWSWQMVQILQLINVFVSGYV